MKPTLSVVLATFNEGKKIAACLGSVKGLADEIIIIDGGSTDQTVEIARKYHAKVTITDNPPIFHINKQKALEKASGVWILQLDADERVSNALKEEIKRVITMEDQEIEQYQKELKKKNLFLRHQEILEDRDGEIGSKEGHFTAFFIPRLNFFLGKFLKYGGVYPDGVIRLVKNGYAHFPCQSVHEQIAIKGRVGWLENDLLHFADTTFQRYLARNSRYINLLVEEFKKEKLNKDFIQFINYCLIKPVEWFALTFIRHKGLLDGFPGLVFSFFSALRFPRAYLRYLKQ